MSAWMAMDRFWMDAVAVGVVLLAAIPVVFLVRGSRKARAERSKAESKV